MRKSEPILGFYSLQIHPSHNRQRNGGQNRTNQQEFLKPEIRIHKSYFRWRDVNEIKQACVCYWFGWEEGGRGRGRGRGRGKGREGKGMEGKGRKRKRKRSLGFQERAMDIVSYVPTYLPNYVPTYLPT
ncbi:hypothetical protein EYC80_002658 [Monilinia laxa]|uniref:Uncharacterized protein n=1 Tax=Monilinia laxa TaxID=61186 RepID=A0A5N6K4R0_MONLA|nr:hypothetical protein EYC80_002658 [Monilinia laxa]